jgi:hypothetical protein
MARGDDTPRAVLAFTDSSAVTHRQRSLEKFPVRKFRVSAAQEKRDDFRFSRKIAAF